MAVAEKTKGEVRHVVCPASGYLHPGMACAVYRTSRKKKPTIQCACMTRVYLGTRWEDGMGLTLEEVVDQQLQLERRSTKVFEHGKADDGTRYAICPASGYLHDGPVAVRIYRTKNKKAATSFCSCTTRVFYSPEWTDRMGLTAAQVEELGLAISG